MENSLCLTMIFRDSSEVKTAVTVPNIREGISSEEINVVMNDIISTGVLCGKAGPFLAKDSAYITAKGITEYKNIR